MKEPVKRSLSLLLAFTLLLAAAPMGWLADIDWHWPDFSRLFTFTSRAATIVDSGTCGSNLTWTLDSDGLLTISGTGEMASYSYNNHEHYTTAPWGGSVSNCERIKTVKI